MPKDTPISKTCKPTPETVLLYSATSRGCVGFWYLDIVCLMQSLYCVSLQPTSLICKVAQRRETALFLFPTAWKCFLLPKRTPHVHQPAWKCCFLWNWLCFRHQPNSTKHTRYVTFVPPTCPTCIIERYFSLWESLLLLLNISRLKSLLSFNLRSSDLYRYFKSDITDKAIAVVACQSKLCHQARLRLYSFFHVSVFTRTRLTTTGRCSIF